jgi:hypothetical protein
VVGKPYINLMSACDDDLECFSTILRGVRQADGADEQATVEHSGSKFHYS